MIYNRRGAGILFSVAPRRKTKKIDTLLFRRFSFHPKNTMEEKTTKEKKNKKMGPSYYYY